MLVRHSRLAGCGLVGLVLALGVVCGVGLAEEPRAGPSTGASAPALVSFWRTFFARPVDGSPVPSPADNPSTGERIDLGRRLFSDTRLSGDKTRSCQSCHEPARAFSDGRARGVARDGSDLARNVPGLHDLAWGQAFMWDGRASSLEQQAAMPIEDVREMGGSWPGIIAELKRDAELDVAFHIAFRERPAIQPATIVKALAAYVRSLRSPQSRFDRWVAGDDEAITAEEADGLRLFVGKAGCVGCHATWRLTDDRFHDVGLRGTDPGRGAVAGGVPGLAAFKTPSLREVARTGPYMHDGSLATLEAVIEHYAGRLEKRPSLSSSLVRGLSLSNAEKAALAAFLRTLSSD